MATKSKKTNKQNIDFSDSLKAIKDTAKTVNAQLKDVTAEVSDDLKENSAVVVEPIKKAYNETMKTVNKRVNMDKISKATQKVNEYTLKTAEELVDGVLENSEKWQKVAQKAMKGGFKLAAQQQDIVFDSLEMVKGQLSHSAKRLRNIFSN